MRQLTHRKDAWSDEEDRYLRSTVLKFIEEDQTKSAAFEKVSRELGRTKGACAYRWNRVLKDQSDHEEVLVKRDIEEIPASHDDQVSFADQLQTCIEYLSTLVSPHDGEQERKELLKERKQLLDKQHELKERYNQIVEKHEKVQQMLSLLQEAENLTSNEKTNIVH